MTNPPDNKPDNHNWYAVHTLSHHERKVQKELYHRSFEVYLPEYMTWSKRKDRSRQILLPLFPGYLFVHTNFIDGRRIDILRTGGVVSILSAGNGPVPIPNIEVKSIQTLLSNGADAAPHPMVKGQLVQVMGGPLSGVVGVVEKSTRSKIVVSVNLVSRGVSATIDTSLFSVFPISP